jgi:ABC-type bacteriocin/lantibiotic exporter with double-glycine peptidase domain
MPNVLLPVPHFEQSRDGTCLPACVRMVLAFWNRPMSEKELASLLGTKPFGTAFDNVEKIKRLGFAVEFGSLTATQLRANLQRNRPVICRLWTVMLGIGMQIRLMSLSR